MNIQTEYEKYRDDFLKEFPYDNPDEAGNQYMEDLSERLNKVDKKHLIRLISKFISGMQYSIDNIENKHYPNEPSFAEKVIDKSINIALEEYVSFFNDYLANIEKTTLK